MVNSIVEFKFGSHLYGTDTPKSDLDFKRIYLPSAKEIVLGTYKESINTTRNKAKFERNNAGDTDIETFSLDRFLDLLMEGQTVALDMLFTPPEMITFTGGRAIFKEIYDNRDKLLTRNVNAFVGYARRQAAVYGIKGSRLDSLKRTMELLNSLDNHDTVGKHADKVFALVKECEGLISLEKTPLVEVLFLDSPDKKSKIPHMHVNGRKLPFNAKVSLAKEVYGRVLAGYGERAHKAHLSGGKDWKALSHAVRVNHEALELLTTGKITFPRPERELLLKIKTEQMEYDQVAEIIEKGLAELHEAHKTSTLREEPDREWANQLVYDVYSTIVKTT
jgi:hypothetical protein